MDSGIVLLVVLANAVVLTLGGVITHLAVRAYRRTGSPQLKAFSLGFGLVTLGLLAGGGVHQLLGEDVLVGVAVQGVASALGFGLLTYSLYVHSPRRTEGLVH